MREEKMILKTAVVPASLKRELLDAMRALNGRHGVVGHDLAEIESMLLAGGVSYDQYDLEEAITELVKDERIIMCPWREKKDSPYYHIAVRSLI